MAFQNSTRRVVTRIGQKSKGTQNPLRWDIPKTGLLAGVHLAIRGSVAGTLSTPNAYGMSSIVRRVRLITNGGLDLVNLTGPQYFWLFNEVLEDYRAISAYTTGRAAVTATTFVLDMYIPTVVNSRDDLGLIMLQNEQTLVQLEVEFEADASVATGATVTATVEPAVEIYTVPLRPEEWPPLSVVQQILGDERSVSGAGDYDYQVPRGNTYLQTLHGFNMGVAATDQWTRAQVLINQSNLIGDYSPALLDIEVARMRGRARVLGTIPVDYAGSAGLGNFGSSRDWIYSAAVTEFIDRLTVSAAGTLNTVRRQLVQLGENG